MSPFSIFETVRQNSLRFIEPEAVLAEVRDVERFCVYVLEQLKPDVKQVVVAAVNSDELGWHTKDNRVGLLLPSHAVTMHLSYATPEDIFSDL